MQNDSLSTDRNLLLIQKKYEARAEHRLKLLAMRTALDEALTSGGHSDDVVTAHLSKKQVALLLVLVDWELELK
jgi:3'-phosphoadenosine 5'-phosphosulfate sulfotransferase (PAPS reductase)/FAD synthetase